MEKTVNAIPKGFHSLTPYLIVKDALKAIEFYKRAFGAEELYRMDANGKIGHCELRIGDSKFFLSDEFPEMGTVAPQGNERSYSLLLYVNNVNETFKNALAAGATVVEELKDQFWGDRMGTLLDPFGHRWSLGTHIEDVSPEEMEKRRKKMFS